MKRLISRLAHQHLRVAVRNCVSSNHFRGWYEKEATDERHRLQLASFLSTLYEAQRETLETNVEHHHPTYKWSEPLNDSNFDLFLDKCLNGNHIVDGTTFHQSIVSSEQILHDRHNISVIVPNIKEVVIIGDLHGDVASLAHLYKLMGPPSDSKAFVFNGDVVDRGSNSAEVLFFILGLMETYPNRVFINRGNHEGTRYRVLAWVLLYVTHPSSSFAPLAPFRHIHEHGLRISLRTFAQVRTCHRTYYRRCTGSAIHKYSSVHMDTTL